MANLIQSISAVVSSGSTVPVNIGNSAGNGTVDTSPGSLLVAYVGTLTTGRTCSASDNVNGAYNTDATSVSSMSICSFPNNGGGPVTVTGACSGAAVTLGLLVEEWAGIVTTAPFDKSASNSAAAQTSGNTGTTPTLSQANELALGAVATNTNTGSPFTVQSPFTGDAFSPVHNGATFFLATGYQLLSSTAGVVANFTWVNSVNYRACIATYKLSAIQGVDTLLGQGWV